MASSGSSYVDVAYSTSGNIAVRLYLDWNTNWQDVASNTSSVHFTLRVVTYGAGAMYGSAIKPWDIWANGVRVNAGNWTIGMGANQNRTIGYGDIQIPHNSDGTKTFELAATAAFDMNFNGWKGSFTVRYTGTLNTIARASQPSCITYPNTTQNIGKMGNKITIHMNRKSSSFTHTVKYAFGNKSATIATGVGDNCSWTIPLNLANQIPNATSGNGTIYADTYNGGTLIGTKTVGFTTSVADNMVPTMNTPTVALDNSANSKIKEWGLWVAGYSKAKITGTASGSYGSTIKGFAISGGVTANVNGSSLNYTTPTITKTGNISFSVSATDSRGRKSSSKNTSQVTVYSYSNPSVTQLNVGRSQDDVTKMIVNANWVFASVNGKNSATGLLKYKEKNSSRWTTYGKIQKGQDIEIVKDEDGFLETKTWDFMLIVTDALGNSSQMTTVVSTLDVLMNFRPGGKGLGIGKVAERDMVEIALPTDFMSDVYIDGTTLEQYVKGVAGGVTPKITISSSEPPSKGEPNSIYIKMI